MSQESINSLSYFTFVCSLSNFWNRRYFKVVVFVDISPVSCVLDCNRLSFISLIICISTWKSLQLLQALHELMVIVINYFVCKWSSANNNPYDLLMFSIKKTNKILSLFIYYITEGNLQSLEDWSLNLLGLQRLGKIWSCQQCTSTCLPKNSSGEYLFT